MRLYLWPVNRGIRRLVARYPNHFVITGVDEDGLLEYGYTDWWARHQELFMGLEPGEIDARSGRYRDGRMV
jgi:hypothetical protein